MNKELSFLVEKVLKKNTNVLLQEIDHLMEEDGVRILLEEGNKKIETGKNSKKANGKENSKVPGKTQFKTLMDAASEASCIEELVLFISYQKSKKHGWENKCANGDDIAKNVTNSLMKIQESVYAEIEKEAEVQEQKIDTEDERILRLRIAEKYMGYLYWKASVVSRY